jgi:hypothetical protein
MRVCFSVAEPILFVGVSVESHHRTITYPIPSYLIVYSPSPPTIVAHTDQRIVSRHIDRLGLEIKQRHWHTAARQTSPLGIGK